MMEYAALWNDETKEAWLIQRNADGTWATDTLIGKPGEPGNMAAAIRIATAMNREQHS